MFSHLVLSPANISQGSENVVHSCRSHQTAPQHSAPPQPGPTGRSMDAEEVRKFEAMAAEWWDPDGSSGALHTMNPLRTRFARDAICLALG